MPKNKHGFDWEDEWKDMPAFKMEKQEPFSKIIVRFETEEDLNEFSELIGQKLTPKTKSIWHPKLVRGIHSRKRFVHEDNPKLKDINFKNLDES